MVADRDTTRADFRDAVNMTRRELSRWLDTDESRSVGVGRDGSKRSRREPGESVGWESGTRIVEILGKRGDDLDEDDYRHMRTVTGYVRRHLAQKPSKEPVRDSRWRYSLMNWGHDPLKD